MDRLANQLIEHMSYTGAIIFILCLIAFFSTVVYLGVLYLLSSLKKIKINANEAVFGNSSSNIKEPDALKQEELDCPKCGAHVNGEVCEYCGTVNIAMQEYLKQKNMVEQEKIKKIITVKKKTTEQVKYGIGYGLLMFFGLVIIVMLIIAFI